MTNERVRMAADRVAQGESVLWAQEESGRAERLSILAIFLVIGLFLIWNGLELLGFAPALSPAREIFSGWSPDIVHLFGVVFVTIGAVALFRLVVFMQKLRAMIWIATPTRLLYAPIGYDKEPPLQWTAGEILSVERKIIRKGTDGAPLREALIVKTRAENAAPRILTIRDGDLSEAERAISALAAQGD